MWSSRSIKCVHFWLSCAIHVGAPRPIYLYYSRLGVHYLEIYYEYGPLGHRYQRLRNGNRSREQFIRARILVCIRLSGVT